MRRLLVTLAALALSASTAGAYYHFIHYTNRGAPYNPVPEKFDLNALPSKTVTFFLSDAAVGQISRNDLPSAVSAIREAARVWNAVDSSDMRVAFGGLASASTPQATPGVDIIFDEMDPLTLGLTSTNAARNPISTGAGGAFVPITRPLVRLNRNLSNWSASGPSFTEAFFLTVVHEMGHALGLQHTFTASVMSTDITRATSLYSPLTADDIAGISYLYPARNFAPSTGSIAGRVTFPNGGGIHLASVVAIRPTGAAISALTDLDGRYRIDGIPPGPYLVYAHPVPPAARVGVAPGDLWLPVDADGRQTVADGPFDTMFYQSGGQGTRDYTQAQPVSVGGGGTVDSVNFSLNRRAAYSIPSVTTYSYFDQTAVPRGFLNGGGTLAAAGSGLTSNGAPTPGLGVSFMGGAPTLTGTLRAYSGVYLALDLVANFGGAGPRHAVFTLPDDIYVRPSGITLVQTRPPFIASAAPAFENNGARSVAVAGTTINPDTKFYFDGLPATLLRFDDGTRAVLMPPPGVAGLRPVITAFNPDGQNSMFLQSNAPMSYSYDSGDAGAAQFSPNTLQAGAETLVEITGGGNFVDGQTMFGIGSSDARIKRLWVVGPNKIWANVVVAPNAALGPAGASVISGFQLISQPFAIQTVAANPRTPVLNSQLVNASPSSGAIYPGATVTLSGSNLSSGTLTVADRPATVVSSSASQITFVIPAGLPVGPAVLKVANGSDTASVAVQIDAVPAGVLTGLAPGDLVQSHQN